MHSLITQIKSCSLCAKHLPNVPKPIISVSEYAKILIVGQAPGQKVQDSGIPWDDASGNTLKDWLEVSKEQFYDNHLFGIMPMGMCFPGTGKSGDLPPRKECAPTWHQKVLNNMPNIQLILLIGKYAQEYYLKEKSKENLTETVRNFSEYLPLYIPLPHPSPRNNIWMKKNEWFKEDVIPVMRKQVKALLTK
jgi:uracil-DNA glycosylase family 4